MTGIARVLGMFPGAPGAFFTVRKTGCSPVPKLPAKTQREVRADMEEGLYESVLTTEIAREVEALRDLHAELVKVDSADQAHVLARHLSGLLHQRLADEKDPDRRLALAKELLVSINVDAPTFAEPMRQLHAVRNRPAPGQAGSLSRSAQDSLERRSPADERPRRALLGRDSRPRSSRPTASTCCARSSCGVGCDCWRTPLQRARTAEVPIRVVTTTYIGGTEREALDRLCATSAPRSRSSTTQHAPACTRRLGCSAATRIRHRICRLFQPVDERPA